MWRQYIGASFSFVFQEYLGVSISCVEIHCNIPNGPFITYLLAYSDYLFLDQGIIPIIKPSAKQPSFR